MGSRSTLHLCSFQSLRYCALETQAKISPGDLSFGESKVLVLSFTVVFLSHYRERTAELFRGDLLGQVMHAYVLRMSSCFVTARHPWCQKGHIRNTTALRVRSHPSKITSFKSHCWIWDFYWHPFSLISCDFVGRRGARRRRWRSNRGPQKGEEVFRFRWEWWRWWGLSGTVILRALNAFAPPGFLGQERDAHPWLPSSLWELPIVNFLWKTYF